MQRAPLRYTAGGGVEATIYAITQPQHEFIEPDGTNAKMYAAYNRKGLYVKANDTNHPANCIVYNICNNTFDVCVSGKITIHNSRGFNFEYEHSYCSDNNGHIIDVSISQTTTNTLFQCVELNNTSVDIEMMSSISGGLKVTKLISGESNIVNELIINENNITVNFDDNTAYIGAPLPPENLTGSFVLNGTTLYSGKASQSNVNYKNSPGTLIDYIVPVVSFSLFKENIAYGSLSEITVKINTVTVGSFNLKASFNETNRVGQQDISSDYNNGGLVDFVNGGSLQIDEVGQTNNISIDQYQHCNFTINLTPNDLQMGYNLIEVTHHNNIIVFECFKDHNNGGDTLLTNPSLTSKTSVLKTLSGVSFYGEDSVFDLSINGTGCFNNTYHESDTPITYIANWGLTGLIRFDDSSVSGVSMVPDIGEIMDVSDYQIHIGANKAHADGVVTLTPRDPYGDYAPVVTPNNSFMINSYEDTSTRTHEGFTDENWRYQLSTNFNIIPNSPYGNWDSNLALTSGNLQVFNIGSTGNKKSLTFPTTNYSIFQPSGGPDYSSFNAGSNFEYIRLFKCDIDNNNGILNVPGLTDTDFISGDIRILIKVPTKTMWLDVWVDFVLGTFATEAIYPTGTDGEGCRINPSTYSPNINNQISFTLGSYSCDSSVEHSLFVKVIYANSSVSHRLEEGFGIINW